ncbi:hypothetical protein SODALDRAFT_140603 [Sodiomyces alkalinus F11]|uniref:Uncharacterized protein n=1 Tax=Sodiomyces alkalinus (strain CBS 110278 / VKM F-3762 / F11) TaxID=1314773 RepID=A0A3N2PZE6_SODAK|nr:hypothetical protein SODALDRAFT_140603 [Sodiomyces alkalinus F11]ROT39884.1 hypothetical protein SODALDRAFT_140603 [Sodiomyces alkalinus F11]
MPRYFLQEFDVVANPATGDPWWIPGDLTEPTSHEDPSETGAQTERDRPSPSPVERNVEVSPREQNHAVSKAPRGYAIARMDALKLIGASRQESTLGGQHIAMIVRRSNLKRSGIIPRLVWRRDMHLVVLENMRRQVVQQLEYFAGLCSSDERSYLTPCSSWDAINRDLIHRGCVLWRSQSDETQDATTTGGSAAGGKGPRDDGSPDQLATLDIPDAKYEKKLPVYNLDRLLGEDHLAILLKTPLFRHNPLLVLGRRRTIPLQLLLWKLQGYLAEYD